MAQANYTALAALPGSFVIRFTADTTGEDLYEYSPTEGTLLNRSPAGMFTDTSIYWIERVRSRGAIVRTDDGGQVYASYSISLHRGDSAQDQNVFLAALSADWSWVAINETTQEWIMWPANDGGERGGGYVNYQITPTFITETGNPPQVSAIAEHFIDGDGGGAVAAFAAGLPTSELVVGLIPNNTFRPAFSMPVLRGVPASSTGGVLAAAVRVAIPVPLSLTAARARATGRVTAAALRVQIPLPPLTAARARATGRVTAAALRVQIPVSLTAARARATGRVTAAALRVQIPVSLTAARARATGRVTAAALRVQIPVSLTAARARATGRVTAAALRVQIPVSLTAARARATGRVTAAALTIQIQIHRSLVAAMASAAGGVTVAALLVVIKQGWEGGLTIVFTYCTPAMLAQVVGRSHLIAAAPDPDVDDAWDEAAVAAALAAVSERVDARIRAAYQLPLADVPAFVTRAVARLAHAELVTEASSTNLIQSRATEAWRLVTDLATGAARLDTTDDDLDGAANPRTRQGRAVRVRAPGRWFPRGRPTGAI